ncbi:MAG: hypothetical protein IPP96_07320 [Chitinophagaceae bacterium]|nr:hypothetical protein [Chitinophagaceae bacterium]
MGFAEFILYPVYVALFYFLFSARRKNYNDPVLEFYHKQGFWIKALAVLPFTLFNTLLSPGDSFGLYYTEGTNIFHLILKDASNIKWLYLPGPEFDQSLLKNSLNLGYFRAENNYMVARVVAMLSFVTFGKYLITNLFFSMIAFSGVWRLYRFFYEQYPHLHKQFAIAILYLPTFVFWSSGILKDPLCISSMGWITYALYEVFYKKKDLLKNLIILTLFGFLLAVLKIYILIAYVPFFFLYLILKNVNLVRNSLLKWGLGLVLISGTVFAGQQVMNSFEQELGSYAAEGITEQIGKTRSSYRDKAAPGGGDSNFSLGVEFDGSLTSLLKMAPAAIIATFYRPFIWESRKISTLLSSFESMFIMLFTLYVLLKAGPVRSFNALRKDPVVLYCVLFSLLFGLFVGATTPNFGSLVRYKIPCMPFYLIALFLIQDRTRRIKNNPAVGGAA